MLTGDSHIARQRAVAAQLVTLAALNEQHQASIIVYFAERNWRVPRWFVSYPSDVVKLAAKVEKGRRP
jgi:hypothetical protein